MALKPFMIERSARTSRADMKRNRKTRTTRNAQKPGYVVSAVTSLLIRSLEGFGPMRASLPLWLGRGFRELAP